MDLSELVMKLVLGGILGMVGQGLRAISGLKKVHDSATQSQKDFSALFQPSQLVVSLLIGFIAGVLAVLTIEMPEDGVDKSTLFLLLGAGYAGTDFIEAFMRKNPIPQPATPIK